MDLQPSRLGDLLERSLIRIEVGTRTLDALNIARSQRIHHLPVFSGSTLVGLVCTCDLAGAPLDSPVDDWMSQPPVVLDAQATARDAADAMSQRGIGSVIVTFEDVPCGIVTRADLCAAGPNTRRWPEAVRAAS